MIQLLTQKMQTNSADILTKHESTDINGNYNVECQTCRYGSFLGGVTAVSTRKGEKPLLSLSEIHV